MNDVRLFWKAMLARSYPRIVSLVREPTWFFQETLLPVLAVSAFALVYEAMGAHAYVGFAILGGALTAFWLNVLWTMGAQLYWERDGGNLQLFIIAPCSVMAILAGMALGGMVITCVRATVILAAGTLLFHVSYEPTSWWVLGLVFLLTVLALYGLGMIFASAFLMWGREAWHIVSLLQEPVYLLSGLNFPVRTLGTSAMAAATLVPLALGVDAMRQVLFGAAAEGFLPLSIEIMLLAVQALAFVVLARFCLARLERRAREEGRLTMRGD